MWNGEKSITLSKLCVLLFIVLLLGVAGSAPWLVGWFVNFSRAGLAGLEYYFLATIYIGFFPAAWLLSSLLRLIRRIGASQVFIPENVELLRRISWSCFMGAGVALVSVYYYYAWFFLAVAAAFMGLIVRVLKNVFAQAVELKDEADYTV